MNDIEERIANARKIIDLWANPGFILLLYFVGAISIIVLWGEIMPTWNYCVLFIVLFVVYWIAFQVRQAVMTDEEKKTEDDELDRSSSRKV